MLLKVPILYHHSNATYIFILIMMCWLKQLEARHQVLDIMDATLSLPRSVIKESTPCSCEQLWE